jgi:hypothetical protein
MTHNHHIIYGQLHTYTEDGHTLQEVLPTGRVVAPGEIIREGDLYLSPFCAAAKAGSAVIGTQWSKFNFGIPYWRPKKS